MTQTTTITVPADTWTELTDADATALRFVNEGPGTLYVKVTTASAPSDKTGAIPYRPGSGATTAETIAILFPGTTGGDRVWAYSEVRNTVSVSQA